MGYKCDIYKDKKGDLLSIYKEKAPLKILSKDNVSMIATLFEPNFKIADDAFEPPKDVEFMDMNNMQQNMPNDENHKMPNDQQKEMPKDQPKK